MGLREQGTSCDFSVVNAIVQPATERTTMKRFGQLTGIDDAQLHRFRHQKSATVRTLEIMLDGLRQIDGLFSFCLNLIGNLGLFNRLHSLYTLVQSKSPQPWEAASFAPNTEIDAGLFRFWLSFHFEINQSDDQRIDYLKPEKGLVLIEGEAYQIPSFCYFEKTVYKRKPRERKVLHQEPGGDLILAAKSLPIALTDRQLHRRKAI